MSALDIDESTRLRSEVSVDFEINRWDIDSRIADNAASLEEMRRRLSEIVADGAMGVESVTVRGAASPDGGTRLNNDLSRRRMESMLEYIHRQTDIPDSLVIQGESVIPWHTFRSLVSDGDYPWKDAVLEVIGEGSDDSPADVDRRLHRLKRLASGRVWHQLAREIFPRMRKAYVIIVELAPVSPPEEKSGDFCDVIAVAEPEVIEPVAAEEATPVDEAAAPEPLCDSGSWRLKSSIPAWAAAVANVAGEWDFACRWSLGIDLAYSAWDYGKATRKFRTFLFRPEARFWFADGHKGWFVEGHLAMVSYNVALPGWEWRIQDCDGTRPALGGGFGVGYRFPLGGNRRWHMECAVGGGLYSLRYDRFANHPGGKLHDTVSRLWGGIDHVALSVVYTLNLKTR
ncbi:MAG: DUF3575 domain-containing protein [Muribaculaceae bacterium]|nr:DUF3575 domain-containing protein [Muribaculaceae bacterium]